MLKIFKKIARLPMRYFFFSIILIAAILYQFIPSSTPTIKLNHQQAEAIGKKIWLNEGAGKIENLVVWNKHEDFPSLGIGHFIWFPKGVDSPFEESFPALLAFIKKKHPIPSWLTSTAKAPWNNREAFYQNINSQEIQDLRELMQSTIHLQVEFIIQRMEAALPKMLNAISNNSKKELIKKRFYRVANTPNGPYALIDYVNFKGEGTSYKERYKNEGWGLLQVLEHMDPDNPDIMSEFSRSADYVLTRRVQNADRDESQWLSGWRKRLNTYLID